MGTPKSAPPELENYEYVRPLGAGGYADVFLYRDRRLGRDVAIKVLHEGQSDAEAKAMAAVSSHAHIVEIYETATTKAGRAYIVMQFYPGPTFAERVKSGPLPVAEVLEVGVQLAGALSSAHQLGILHRDIKPANILTSEFSRAGLTDFGIASDITNPDEPVGVSLPWVPPEVLIGEPSEERSDIYALAATLFTLLEGRAPYVVPGGTNNDAALMARTLNDPIPEVVRNDAPASLRSLLRAALAREPERRPSRAEEFGRALQAIEVELTLAQTPLDVKRPHVPVPDRTDDDATRGRGVRVFDSDGNVGKSIEAQTSRELIDQVPRATSQPGLPSIATKSSTNTTIGELPPLEDTHVPHLLPTEGAAVVGTPKRSPWVLAGSALTLAVIAGLVIAAMTRSPDNASPGTGFTTTMPSVAPALPPRVKNLVFDTPANGSVVVHWTMPNQRKNDRFQVRVTVGNEKRAPESVRETSFTITQVPAGRYPCVEVTAERSGRQSDAVDGCAPVGVTG